MTIPHIGQPGTLVALSYLAFAAGSAFGILVRHRASRPRYTFDNVGATYAVVLRAA